MTGPDERQALPDWQRTAYLGDGLHAVVAVNPDGSESFWVAVDDADPTYYTAPDHEQRTTARQVSPRNSSRRPQNRRALPNLPSASRTALHLPRQPTLPPRPRVPCPGADRPMTPTATSTEEENRT